MNTNRQAATTVPTEALSGSRKLAIAAGICYLITHVTSVTGALLYGPVLNNAAYITGPGRDTQVLLGAFLEVICAMANIGTAVALFPVAKKYSEGLALGYVGLRTLEGGIIAAGVVPLLALVTLRQHFAELGGTGTGTLVTLGHAFTDFYYWTSLLGPGLVCGVNTVVMAYLLYRSRLVPRFIPVLGLVGGPLVFAFSTVKMFGASVQLLSWAGVLVIPIFTWEISLAIRLIVKGFKSSALAALTATSPRSVETQTNEVFSVAPAT